MVEQIGATEEPKGLRGYLTMPVFAALMFALLIGILVFLAVHITLETYSIHNPPENVVWMLLGAGAVYLVGCGIFVVSRWKHHRRAANTMLVVGILIRLCLVPSLIFPTSDMLRYLWDGRQLATGHNPFASVPFDPQNREALSYEVFETLEHRKIQTVYPPTSQIFFGLFWLVRPASFEVFKIGFTLADIVMLLLLRRILKQNKQPPAWIAIPSLLPIGIFEIAGAGHQDSLAACFFTLFLLYLTATPLKSRILAGGFWAIGVLSKGYIIIVGILMARKTGWRGCAAAAAIGGIIFLPFYLTTPSMTEGIKTYSANWIAYGSVYRLFTLREGLDSIGKASLLGDWVCLVCLLLNTLICSFLPAKTSEQIALRCRMLLGGTVLFAKVYFPWYFVAILPVVTLAPSAAWLWFGAILPILYFYHSKLLPTEDESLTLFLYIPFYLLLVAEWFWRYLKPRLQSRVTNTDNSSAPEMNSTITGMRRNS